MKKLIVTETIRYEFEVPASMPDDESTLKRFFGRQTDPWTEAVFAAVIERDFKIEQSREWLHVVLEDSSPGVG